MKRFLDFIELRTKVTSVLVFGLTLTLLYALGQPISWRNTVLFFASMFLFDLTTTAINNYIDTKTNGESLPYPRNTAKIILYTLFTVSTALGLMLAYRTDVVVLLTGGLCFLCGVCYTWGPVPISRLPLGELLSGLFYGLLIPFLMLYINLPQGTLLSFEISIRALEIHIQFMTVLAMLLFAVTPACATANIMLANNLCDVEKDRTIGRFTLAHYIGKYGTALFAGLYYAAYAAFTVLIIWKRLSPVCLLTWLSLIPVQKNINRFRKEQNKKTTFVLSVQNFIWLVGAQIFLLSISGLLARIIE